MSALLDRRAVRILADHAAFHKGMESWYKGSDSEWARLWEVKHKAARVAYIEAAKVVADVLGVGRGVR